MKLANEIVPKETGHQLQGDALKQWWQASKGKDKAKDKYANAALRSHVMFLTSLPFFMVMYFFSGYPYPETIKTILLAAAIGVLDWPLFWSVVQRHLRRILEVCETEDGLLLKSLFFERKVSWYELSDFFPLQNGDYLFCCRGGEQFMLSSDLTDSAQLFELIANKVGRQSESYDLNYYVPMNLIDSSIMACFAVMAACLIPLVQWLLNGSGSLTNSLSLIIGAVIALVAGFVWRLHLTKVAELTRVGKSSVFIQTRSGTRVIPLEQITSVKRLGIYVLVRTRNGFWLTITESKEPLTLKLLEQEKFLLAKPKK
jgi:hypothetical protein